MIDVPDSFGYRSPTGGLACLEQRGWLGAGAACLSLLLWIGYRAIYCLCRGHEPVYEFDSIGMKLRAVLPTLVLSGSFLLASVQGVRLERDFLLKSPNCFISLLVALVLPLSYLAYQVRGDRDPLLVRIGQEVRQHPERAERLLVHYLEYLQKKRTSNLACQVHAFLQASELGHDAMKPLINGAKTWLFLKDEERTFLYYMFLLWRGRLTSQEREEILSCGDPGVFVSLLPYTSKLSGATKQKLGQEMLRLQIYQKHTGSRRAIASWKNGGCPSDLADWRFQEYVE